MSYVLIDSNIWIFANTEESPEHNQAVNKIKEAEKSGIIINDIVFSEVYHKLSILLKSKLEAKDRVEKILNSSYVVLIPIEKHTAKDAMKISVSKNLRINDSLIAQHCIENDFHLLTDDVKDFSKIEGLKIVGLR